MHPPRKSLRLMLGRAGLIFVPAPLLSDKHNRALKIALCRDVPSKEFIASFIRLELADLYRTCYALRDLIRVFGWEKFWAEVKQHVSWAKNDMNVTEALLEELAQKLSEAREKYHALKLVQPTTIDKNDESLFQAVDTWINYLYSWHIGHAPFSHLVLSQTTTEHEESVDMMAGLVFQHAENLTAPRSKQWKQKVKEAHLEELAKARGKSHPAKKIQKRKLRNTGAGAQHHIDKEAEVLRSLKRIKLEEPDDE